MLSVDQQLVLRNINELKSSTLDLDDQKPFVQSISERLLSLQDEAEYEEITCTKPGNRTHRKLMFVKICRQKLLEAQHESLANYSILKSIRTRKLDPTDNSDAADSLRNTAELSNESTDDFQQSLREHKSQSISQVLQRMHAMATTEIMKSEINISELDLSSKTLRELQEKYSAIDVLLNGSRKLVKILDEADKWDRRCMLASLAFLASVLCYIIYRRILSGPVRLVLWALFKICGLARLFGFTTDNNALTNPALADTDPSIALFSNEKQPPLHILTAGSAFSPEIASDIPADVTSLLENALPKSLAQSATYTDRSQQLYHEEL